MTPVRLSLAALGLMLATTAPGLAQDVQTATCTGAVLRVLDKINGEVMDLELRNGAGKAAWRIEVELGECRYPAGNPAGDAFSFVTLRQKGEAEPLFRGWMIASAPALNALDHPRYDVWVIRCTTA
ncbi:MAG: DUF2155 domain-containing protein [Rhodobacterales bacterium]|nr:DUF2155 domain-containing protein [Rhodobacterales bacterium]MDX5412655.1 DUF2155 domain-containing protein [Rhodobacterales bacterium]